MKTHAVDRNKWSNMSILDQMGNISSEVGRSFNAKRRGDTTSSQAAMVRAIDLFDATADTLVTRHSPRVKEVLRAKEQYLDVLLDNKASNRETQDLERYFMQFAVAARLKR